MVTGKRRKREGWERMRMRRIKRLLIRQGGGQGPFSDMIDEHEHEDEEDAQIGGPPLSFFIPSSSLCIAVLVFSYLTSILGSFGRFTK